MTTYARNLTEGSGNPAPPAPPPPPPDLRVRMLAATERAARQANRIYDALACDPDASFAAVYAAWDVAAVALTRHARLARRMETRRVWREVQPR